MSYTYATFQQALAAFMAVPNNSVTDLQFVAALPSIIDYAEERCYADLDLSALTAAPQYFQATPRLRNLPITANPGAPQILIVERIGVYTPLGITPPSPGAITLNPCAPTSVEWLDLVYGDNVAGLPRFYAMRDDMTVVFGPDPDQAYWAAIVGKAAYTPLYSVAPGDGTQTTWLTSHVPALFLAAAMISGSGFQKNFGAQMDDPRQAVSWESQYQALLPRAQEFAMRQRQHGWMQVTGERGPPPVAPGTPGPPP